MTMLAWLLARIRANQTARARARSKDEFTRIRICQSNRRTTERLRQEGWRRENRHRCSQRNGGVSDQRSFQATTPPTHRHCGCAGRHGAVHRGRPLQGGHKSKSSGQYLFHRIQLPKLLRRDGRRAGKLCHSLLLQAHKTRGGRTHHRRTRRGGEPKNDTQTYLPPHDTTEERRSRRSLEQRPCQHLLRSRPEWRPSRGLRLLGWRRLARPRRPR